MYAIQQLSSDVCTYLRSFDNPNEDFSWPIYILGNQYQQFRSICMSRIHSMWIKVSTRGIGSINGH